MSYCDFLKKKYISSSKLFLQIIILLFLCFISLSVLAEDLYTLNSPLSGSWYTSNATKLEKQLKQYLENAKERKLENILALLLPHAGYTYSGQTAAYGIKEIAGKEFSKIIILGPSHRYPLKNKICIPENFKAIKTPLGEIELDETCINQLNQNKDIVICNDNIQYNEHSIQIEIPLLQVALKQFKIVPIVVGQLDSNHISKAASILKPLIDKNTLVIVSSDFTHYGENYNYKPFPLNFQTEEKLKEYDMAAVRKITDLDVIGFNNFLLKTGITVCGSNPIKILLSMLPSNTDPVLLHYDTSGKQMNDFTNSVSYVSMAFTGTWTDNLDKKENLESKQTEEVLTKQDKENLLKLARKTLIYYIKNKKMPIPEELGIKITPNMRKVMGVFVTLHEFGMLRGCIGEIMPTRPLYEAVMDQAVNSGLRDYRFPQVKEKEIPDLVFEISALTPPVIVSSYKDIVLGKDGIIISKHGHHAVYLPQVAPEQGWNIEQTLSHLSLKAGLPSDAWKKDASFTTFQAIVFNEEK